MASSPLTIGTLIRNSFSFLKEYFKPFLLASIVFGGISTAAQFAIETIEVNAERVAYEEMGVEEENIEKILALAEIAGEEEIDAILMQSAGFKATIGVLSDQEADERIAEIGLQALFQILPALIAVIGVLILVGFVYTLYFLIIVIRKKRDAGAILSDIPSLFFPLIGMSIWTFLRSFAWVMILGVILSLFNPAIGMFTALGGLILFFLYIPRLFFANIILVQEKKGVFECVQLSYERTKGFWCKIVGNFIVLMLVTLAISLAVGIPLVILLIVGAIGGAGMWFMFAWGWMMAILQYIVWAYSTIFSVLLSDTIRDNPRAS